jgi:oligopeptide/dipeptide ABC transporter ATP-binding protein
MAHLLDVRDLSICYRDGERTVRAVDRLSFTLDAGETLALVGESGSGKTTTALGVMGLIRPPGKVLGGQALLEGRDLLSMSSEELRRLRGRVISMIFQDPQAGLNPVLTVGQQVAETVEIHLRVPRKEARRITIDALAALGLSDPEVVASRYPFQLSGGMAQRVMIAIATVLRPRVIIADEPTSALDVTVQAAILAELDRLRAELGSAILLITHDLGVVAQMAQRVAVMYAGRIVETGHARDIFRAPRHPYTWSLLSTLPRLDRSVDRLPQIKGQPPDLSALSGECAFLPRCPKAVNACRSSPWPDLAPVGDGHAVACFNPVLPSVV